jgi:D-aminoacyl-tRNA deacylase
MVKFTILYSKKDIAGINIAEQLKEIFIDIPIIELEEDSINSENIDKELKLDADFIIFATRHKSAAGTPSLSLHAPGNWRDAEHGGKPGKICSTSSQILKHLFQELNKNAQDLENYEITLECTHHGPLINKPCCFIELGSSEKQWEDKQAAKVIAKTISSLQNFKPNRKIKTAIGIGGPHYCPNFNKIQLSNKSDLAISHIIPEYVLPLTETMLKQALEKTQEHIDFVLIDWKGLGKSEDRKKTLDLLEKLGLDYERTEKIEK